MLPSGEPRLNAMMVPLWKRMELARAARGVTPKRRREKKGVRCMVYDFVIGKLMGFFLCAETGVGEAEVEG